MQLCNSAAGWARGTINNPPRTLFKISGTNCRLSESKSELMYSEMASLAFSKPARDSSITALRALLICSGETNWPSSSSSSPEAALVSLDIPCNVASTYSSAPATSINWLSSALVSASTMRPMVSICSTITRRGLPTPNTANVSATCFKAGITSLSSCVFCASPRINKSRVSLMPPSSSNNTVTTELMADLSGPANRLRSESSSSSEGSALSSLNACFTLLMRGVSPSARAT